MSLKEAKLSEVSLWHLTTVYLNLQTKTYKDTFL